MNDIYCINWWIPFPSSEYGGILVISAKDRQELLKIMFESTDVYNLECLKIIDQDTTDYTDISEIDKDELELYFERFVNYIFVKGVFDWDKYQPIGTTHLPSGVIRSFIT